MSAEAPPKYIYKIIPLAPEDPIPDEHPLSDLDRNDGFVHLSTSTQVPKTADLFFTSASSLWVIKLELAQFSSALKWEDGFPHLYGNFGGKNVDSVEKFVRPGNQTWGQVMAKSQWLE
ncbi:hypothetical protein FGRMN_9430 [Fusarium graminum]|nr:hypothetical protein FGRMN_9430 [Fusarium graminum]